MSLVLGVDSSPTSTTVELRDAEDGHLYGSGRAPHGAPPDARGDHDPSEWWHSLVEARYGAGGALNVNAVSVAAPSDGLVVVDDAGDVVRPAKIGPDPETCDDARALVDELGPDVWSAGSGSVPTASSPIAKLAWLRRVEPGAFARVAKVLTPHDWLTFRLSRRYVTDRGDASATGYWSPRESRWRPDLLAVVDPGVDWGALLPDVLGPVEPAGDREGVYIAPGTGRYQATALGLGLRPHDVVVALETAGTVCAVRERPTEDASGAVSGRADATGRFLPLARSCGGVHSVAALAAQFGIDMARLDQLALGSPPGARGVRLVPFDDADDPVGRLPAGGRLTGLRVDTTQEDVARALVEGVVCALLDGLDRLRAADVPVGGRLFVQGYAARSHAFQRALADLSERTVFLPHTTDVADTSALGACVQAAAMLYQVDPAQLGDLWGLAPTRVVEPDYGVDADAIRADYTVPRAA
ncbi:MAG TPA: FGGY family carbohydrate kinase [Acidimicrobiia bacterium]|nr:FGGY family carbohydrate kinase [Acidimicrobiia bacterium]